MFMRRKASCNRRLLAAGAFLLIALLAAAAVGCGQQAEEPQEPPQEPEEDEQAEEEEELSSQKQRIVEMRQRFGEPDLAGAFSVVVSNCPDARPQTGLQHADVVWEMELEGGITRYLAVFYSQAAEKIGPIRSARLYMVEVARGYDVPFFHAGGNLDALDAIPNLGVKSLCDIYNAGGFAWRTDDRQAPHNLYINTEKLQEASDYRSFEPTEPDSSWPSDWAEPGEEQLHLPYKSEGIWQDSEESDGFRITYADYDHYHYATSYHYQESEYEKHVNGEQLTTADGADITADNMIVVLAPGELVKPPGEWDWQLDVELTGSGQAWIFSGGRVLKGRWTKDSPSQQMAFLTEDGETIKLPAGVTWVNHITDRTQLQIDRQGE